MGRTLSELRLVFLLASHEDSKTPFTPIDSNQNNIQTNSMASTSFSGSTRAQKMVKEEGPTKAKRGKKRTSSGDGIMYEMSEKRAEAIEIE